MAQFYPLLIPAVLIFLAWSSRRLKRVVQPLRLKIAVKGEELLAENNLSDSVKEQIHLMLDTAFGARRILLASLLAMPFFSIIALLNRRFFENAEREFHISDLALRTEYEDLDQAHTIVMFANNPILSTLVCAEFVVFLPVIMAGRMILYGTVLSPLSTASVLTRAIDQKGRYLHMPQSKAA
ncbi:MAG: hypothetical protein EPN75_11680 [Beijerinckiaceae bacterium]|nr:MAG: hypothetical protein EPN75_11680 [Beijerinckiaceae bacterium]